MSFFLTYLLIKWQSLISAQPPEPQQTQIFPEITEMAALFIYFPSFATQYLHIRLVFLGGEKPQMQIWHSDVSFSIHKVNSDEDTC